MPKKEADFTRELLDLIRERFPRLAVLKHADRFTKGIPDASISNRNHQTIWLEIKRFTNPKQMTSKPRSWVDNLVQLDLAVRLGAYYLVIDPFRDEYLYLRAERVWQAIQSEMPAPKPHPDHHEFHLVLPARHHAWGWVAIHVGKILGELP